MRSPFFLIGLCVAGCQSSALPVIDAGVVYPSIDAANAVPKGDAREEGQYRFLHDAWGTEQFRDLPPAAFLVELQTKEPETFGNQFAAFGWLPDPNDDLPIGLKRGLVDSAEVHETCAACHVGKLPDGRLWLGAPNNALDIEGFRLAVNDRWVKAGNPSRMTAGAIAKAAFFGPGRTNAATSSYEHPVPAKFPPYFNLGARTRMNYLGTGRNVRSEAYLSIFSFGAGDPTTSLKLSFPPKANVDAFLAFFSTLEAPSAPAQPPALVEKGRAVFAQAKCDTCHHPDDVSKDGVIPVPEAGVPEYAPGENASYPNGTIQTDVLHRILIAQNSQTVSGDGEDLGYLSLLEFIEENSLQVGATDGYRVGALEALWARAPYLHNGSVPTLADLFKPVANRPTTFMLGRFEFDTRLLGNHNEGHEFGTTLSESDRAALVAYLSSL